MDMEDRTPRGHDLTLLQELQELTPAQRITRNCEMADWIEKLQAALLAPLSCYCRTRYGRLRHYERRRASVRRRSTPCRGA